MKLIGMLFVTAALALPRLAAAAQDVSALEKATKIMGECSAIADEIAKEKAPEGIAQARAMRRWNMQATDPKHKVALESHHDAFLQKMDGHTRRLEECGKAYDASVVAAEKRIEELDKLTLSDAEGAPIGAAFQKYHEAREKLAASVENLSKDRQVQSMVHVVLRRHFLHKAGEQVEVKKVEMAPVKPAEPAHKG